MLIIFMGAICDFEHIKLTSMRQDLQRVRK